MFHSNKEISIKVDKQQVLRRLKIMTEKSNPTLNLGISVGTDRKRFSGYVKEDSFEIFRILGYRNSFNPLITGKIIEEDNEKTLTLDFTLKPIDKGFLITFGIIISIIFLVSSISIIKFSLITIKSVFIILCFPIGYILFLGIGLLIFNSIIKDNLKLLKSICYKR
jgi:hypothetical protein